MAYQDALFQLGMDLTRSSTAQKEDQGESARLAQRSGLRVRDGEDRKNHVIESRVSRAGAVYAGQHVIIDLFGATKLGDPEHIGDVLRRCVGLAGTSLLHLHLHQISPNGGVSGVGVLPDGQVSVHTRPETGYAAFDVFMTDEAGAHRVVAVLREAFDAAHAVVKEHRRGDQMDEIRWQPQLRKAPARVRRVKVA